MVKCTRFSIYCRIYLFFWKISHEPGVIALFVCFPFFFFNEVGTIAK